MLGIIFSFSHSFTKNSEKKFAFIFTLLGFIAGSCVFGIRVYDPRGMNLILMAFNRRLVVAIAGAALTAVMITAMSFMIRNHVMRLVNLIALSVLILVSLISLVPPFMQYTREFVYFGESGISTNAMLRALGFTLGLFVCLLLALSTYEVHKSLSTESQRYTFMLASVIIFACEYSASAVAALQRLKLIPLTDMVFKVMIWRGENPNAFLFAQLILALVMLAFVIATHMKPEGTFPNKAMLRKEKARLRDCRRWSWSLCAWGVLAVFIVIVLHYYDTKPPAEVQPEPYELNDGMISIELTKVSDGHLHKFSYVTPGGYDVRFLVVKKPAGSAYGVGLDACDICGIAGYYERGNDEVVCRRCDVVMNKNTIGFKGGCNPVPFEYEVRSGKIFIDVKELEKHEKRFK